ncbi:hypothetical protein PPGU19_065870 (plasmid) [Paraburkholderia sp. PGU19]|nr:hypothetical protein PPGU19_065870 [Paraburkholderia sp. PGU19]
MICSPNAYGSEYVNHEIKAFLQSHDAKAIIPILLSGKPNNDQAARPDEYAFPEALCSAFSMPLAVDYTEFQRTQGNIRKGRYQNAWYTLLAKVFKAERAEIERQDARRQALRRTILSTISLTVAFLLLLALVVTLRSRDEAIAQRNNSQRLRYASDMNLSQREFESDNIGPGKALVESHRVPDRDQEDLRGFEWYYLWRLYNEQLKVFDGTDGIGFSRDGRVFATATANALKIWDAASLRETANIELSVPRTYTSGSDIAFSPDGKTIAFGDSESVVLLDVNSRSFREVPVADKRRRPGQTQNSTDSPKRLSWDTVRGGTPRFSPDGKLLAVSYECGMVAVYDAHSLKQIARLGDGPPASFCSSFIAFSPDGSILAYGDGYTVRLWDVGSARDLGGPEMDVSLADSVDQVEAIAFSRDGKILAIGDRSKNVVLWNISTKKVLARLAGHTGWVSAVAFSPDGKILYSGSVDQTVKLWDFSSYDGNGQVSGEKIKVFATIKGHTGQINSISTSRGGKIIATVAADRTVKLWGKLAGRDFDAVENVEAVSSAANLIARQVAEGERITLFDLRSGVPMQVATVKALNPTLSPDGKMLATASYGGPSGKDGTIQLWNVSSRRQVTVLARFAGQSPAFSQDGQLFTALSSDGKSLILWDAVNGRMRTSVMNDAAMEDYCISANGKVIVTVDKDGPWVKSWDAASGRQLARFERKTRRGAGSDENEGEAPTTFLALSGDGKFLAYSDSKDVWRWETDSTHGPVLLGHRAVKVSALSFSPEGNLVAVGEETGTVEVWGVDPRKALSFFNAYNEAVTALAFSPDGRTLASGGGGTVKLYGMASLRELITLAHDPSPTSEIHGFQGKEDTVLAIYFAPNGRSLFTLSGNGTLRIWRGANDESVPVREQ